MRFKTVTSSFGRYALVAFLLLQACTAKYCFSQEAHEDSLFNDFRNATRIGQDGKSGLVWDDDTKDAYYSLLSVASVEALRKYTDDTIPAIRAEIFAGLVQKNAEEKLLEQIINSHVDDTAQFTSRSTDVVITWSVKGYMQFLMDNRVRLKSVDYQGRIKEIRNRPRMILPGERHGSISRHALLEVHRLLYSVKGIGITSFKLSTGRKSMRSTDNALTKQMKRVIRKLKLNDRIYFDEIIALFPDNTKRHLGSIALRIK